MSNMERGGEGNAELLALHRIDETSTRLQQQGKYLEALECMERGLVLRQHFFGPSSDEVWSACTTVGQMCNLLAMTYLQQEEFSMVLELLKKAEILTERDDRGRAVTYNNLACYFRRTGKLHAALQYLQKALKVESRLDNVTNRADTHLNLCAVLSQLGRHAGALEHAQAALIQLQEELFPSALSGSGSGPAAASADRIAVLAIAYHNIGVEQEFLKRFEMAIDSYRKGVDISETHLGTDHGITITLRNSYLAAKQAVEVARKRRGPMAKTSRIVSGGKSMKGSAKGAALKRSPRLQQREEQRWGNIQKAYGDVAMGLKPTPSSSSDFNLNIDYQQQQNQKRIQKEQEEEEALAAEVTEKAKAAAEAESKYNHESEDEEENQEDIFDRDENNRSSEEEEEEESMIGRRSTNMENSSSVGYSTMTIQGSVPGTDLASVQDLITPRDENALEILENDSNNSFRRRNSADEDSEDEDDTKNQEAKYANVGEEAQGSDVDEGIHIEAMHDPVSKLSARSKQESKLDDNEKVELTTPLSARLSSRSKAETKSEGVEEGSERVVPGPPSAPPPRQKSESKFNEDAPLKTAPGPPSQPPLKQQSESKLDDNDNDIVEEIQGSAPIKQSALSSQRESKHSEDDDDHNDDGNLKIGESKEAEHDSELQAVDEGSLEEKAEKDNATQSASDATIEPDESTGNEEDVNNVDLSKAKQGTEEQEETHRSD